MQLGRVTVGRVFLALACLSLVGCTQVRNPEDTGRADAAVRPDPGPANAWPAWPTSEAEAKALVEQHRRRAERGPRPDFKADEILALLRRGIQANQVAAGWPMIVDRLRIRLDTARHEGRDAYLLFGTWHDSGLQLDALRRLIGPDGIAGFSALVIEQFDADGHWTGVEDALQRGDTADLAAWNEHADRAAFARLRAAQRRDDYTAFKYGTLDQVMDLLVSARAAGIDVLGCDMPPGLQRRLTDQGAADLDSLRELHCLLAWRRARAERAEREPILLAMLWGQDHVAPAGLPAFLPTRAEVVPIYAFGGRPVDHGLAAELAGRLAIGAPMLVPLDAGAGYLLLLPGARLGAKVELKRVARTERDTRLPSAGLLVRSPKPGELTLLLWRGPVDAEARVPVPPGDWPFLFTWAGGALAGGLHLPSGGAVELDLEPAGRGMQLTEHDPEAPP